MNSFFQYRLRILIAIIILSLCSILFVGTIKDPTTNTTSLGLTLQGVSSFTMGLDVAGGVKLTYKIDYSKYKEIYTDPNQLKTMKDLAEQIVLNNIDNRISKLGVSDYNAYTQVLNDEDYVIVEIGGVADIDQAKQMIGKTVELEFKLENKEENTPEGRNQRKQLAEDLLKKATTNPANFPLLAVGRESDDIYYQELSGISLGALPDIYSNNASLLKSMKTGSLHPALLEGTFIVQQGQNEAGELTQTPLIGHTIIKLLDRTTVPVTALSPQFIASKAKEFGLNVESDIRIGSLDIASGSTLYDAQSSSLLYNNGMIFSGQEAGDVEVYKIDQPTLIGLSADEAQKRTFATKQKESEVISALNKNTAPTMSGVSLIFSGWIDRDQLQTQISGVLLSTEGVLVYNQPSGIYIVKTRTAKQATQPAYSILVVTGLGADNQASFQSSLKEDTLYSVQHIFVRDRTSRIAAKDSQSNKILNGSYFSIAKVSQDNLGKPAVSIEFNEEGKNIFCDITTRNIKQPMAIFVGGQLQTSAIIQEKLCAGQAIITSPTYTSAEVKALVDSLNDGAMPVPLILTQEEKVSPLVGEHALSGAIWSGIVAIIVLFVMMSYMYSVRYALVSLAVLGAYIIITFGFIKIAGYALSLSGIAAIVLSIGMAIDACILLFERHREELAKGKSHKTAIMDAAHRSRPAILDGNLSTGIIGILLSLIGMNIFKGFGAMMVVNMVLILLINVPLAVHLMLLWLRPTSSPKQ